MASSDAFATLSPAEQVALLYAAGTRTQKDLMDRFGVSRPMFLAARETLVSRGVLDSENQVTPQSTDLIPPSEWVIIRQHLSDRVERESARASALLNDVNDLRARLSVHEQEVSERQRASADTADLTDLLDQFQNMGINVHWVRSVAALALVELALKRKLDDLGKLPKKNSSVGDLKTLLDEALRERGGTELSPRLLGPEELDHVRNSIIHQRHQSLSVLKSEADHIVGIASDLVREILE